MLSAVVWTNPSGGNWDVGSNWSSGQTPGAGDDAVIAIAVSTPITIQPGDNLSVRSVTTSNTSDTLSITGGSLTVLGDSDSATVETGPKKSLFTAVNLRLFGKNRWRATGFSLAPACRRRIG